MTKKKSTKRALFTSVMALLVCVVMLAGTTFAWLTDSVTSGVNPIVAGNLDVELEYYADGKWNPVTESTNVFKEDTLWEPGHTEVVYLKASNLGTLALKYYLGVSVFDEVTSINVNNEELRLSEHIVYDVIEDVEIPYTTREDARKYAALSATAPVAVGTAYNSNGVLYAKGDTAGESEKYVAFVVYMPESVGNEANYKTGEKAPEITLALRLEATQWTHEEDSFDEKYDDLTNVDLVTKETVTETVTVFDLNNTGSIDFSSADEIDLTFDAYTFEGAKFAPVYDRATYGDWLCDFFVSTDRGVEEGIKLVGKYGGWGWLGFNVPANVNAYPEIGLLGFVTSGGASNWTYNDILDNVGTFICGIDNVNDANKGTEVTVTLRMTNPNDATDCKNAVTIKVVL